jgi:hypothetical protein
MLVGPSSRSVTVSDRRAFAFSVLSNFMARFNRCAVGRRIPPEAVLIERLLSIQICGCGAAVVI